jgi:hypothetical protein
MRLDASKFDYDKILLLMKTKLHNENVIIRARVSSSHRMEAC